MNRLDISLEDGQVEKLLKEIAAVAADPHIPEGILRAYLADNGFAEEMEDHLADCDECRGLADRIILETSPWRNDSAHLEQIFQNVQQLSQRPPHPLASALDTLISQQQRVPDLLAAWWKRVTQEVDDIGVILQVELNAGQAGRILPFAGWNQPYLHLAAGVEQKGSDRGSSAETSVLMSAEGVADGEISVVDGRVTVTLFDAPSLAASPLLLVPQNDPDAAGIRWTTTRESNGTFEATFDDVPPGSYLLAIPSAEKPVLKESDELNVSDESEQSEPSELSGESDAARAISPTIIQQIETLLPRSTSDLLIDIGRQTLVGTLNATELSVEEEQDEAVFYLQRIASELRRLLCADTRLKAYLNIEMSATGADPAPAQTVSIAVHIADLLRTLPLDVRAETLAVYLVKGGLKELCLPR